MDFWGPCVQCFRENSGSIKECYTSRQYFKYKESLFTRFKRFSQSSPSSITSAKFKQENQKAEILVQARLKQKRALENKEDSKSQKTTASTRNGKSSKHCKTEYHQGIWASPSTHCCALKKITNLIKIEKQNVITETLVKQQKLFSLTPLGILFNGNHLYYYQFITVIECLSMVLKRGLRTADRLNFL